ncbi:methyltransferase domain-containing protein [Serratia marcescens]|nr:methyltransferase domain-containing protein [Serratia marcescens]ELQ9439413.1 methyltransferase domain-containing protein [Serratia marcescens]ELT5559806.1 methyltransferase domain-containing protein [Serratia marcescens]
MSISNSHKNAVDRQFGEQANAYLTSAVHAQGKDLQRLAQLLEPHAGARLLDLGCGAGHASFTAAAEKGLSNIQLQQGVAESLPFEDASFDLVISRYSAHHWHDVGQALREVKRVLKPGGRAIFMDVVSPGHPLLDIYLQTVEVLRDTSHVRNYAPGEWLALLTEAGLVVREVTSDRLMLEFGSWVARMRTPAHFVTAIRALQQSVSQEVAAHFAIQPDGSFTSDIMMFDVTKG